MSEETVSFSLEVNVEPTAVAVRRFLTLLTRAARIVRRLTGNENLERATMIFQRHLAVVNRLRLAYALLQGARMAAGDPLAWGMAIIGGAEAVMSAGDLVMEAGS